MKKLVKLVIWTPESDNDSKTIEILANKISEFYQSNIKITLGKKQAFSEATKKPDGLKKAVEIYLKSHDYVIFLLDIDGPQSTAQRLQEPNSLINQVKKVVGTPENAILIMIDKELEAWLLIDCLGICCYYNQTDQKRVDQSWINFAEKYQKGDTSLIVEVEIGGKGVKEYLTQFSKEILKKINPNLKDKDLKKRQYSEYLSPEIATYIQITKQTLARNKSLQEFANYCQDQQVI